VDPLPAPVAPKFPCGGVIGQHDVEERADPLLQLRILHGRHDLEAAIEIARHEIGTAYEVRDLLAGLKYKDPAVLEESADDRAHGDGLAQPWDTRLERGDAPGDDVDLRALLGSSIELRDDRLVSQRVHLDPDPRGLSGGGRLSNSPDLGDQPVAEIERRDEELPKLARSPEAGDVVEEVGDVRCDVVVGREEPEVLVQARVAGMVVARADVDVTA
jgi:hypothetical protein